MCSFNASIGLFPSFQSSHQMKVGCKGLKKNQINFFLFENNCENLCFPLHKMFLKPSINKNIS